LDETQEAVIQRLKAKACAMGAHVIFGVTATTSGQWNDKSTSGSALAAVYVDEQGRPMPAPTGSASKR
jgi:hypothetical protein